MNRRSLLTLSTFACLCGMCALYIALVSPFVSPGAELLSEKRSASEDIPHRTPENQRQAEQFLPDQPWAATARYQVTMRAGQFVYADTWEKIEQSGRVRFRPFAMIWRSEGHAPDQPPITIVCESAIVEFAENFDVAKPDPGRVVGGALEGDVRIRGPNRLAVDGRDFNFSEGALRAWSDNQVTFAYLEHTGNGQGLELDLVPEQGPPGKDKPAIAGVRTLRLRKDVVMDLVGQERKDGRPADTVHVTSAGRFEYSVETNVASFHDDVRVAHPTGNEQYDRLNCQLLTLIFEPAKPAEGEQPAAPPSEGTTTSSPLGNNAKLEFRRLRAEGANTTASSQRSEFQARMQELTYDAEARVIALRDAKSVRVLQKENELICPEITAVLDEDGQLEQAICRGAGKLFRYAKPLGGVAPVRKKENIELAAEWLRELQMRPDPETQLDLIELTGRAVVSQTNRMALKGEEIRLWITPESKDKKEQASASTENRSRLEEDAKPRRMQAIGDVAFASPKITGETERLEVWFEDGPLPAAPNPRAARRRESSQSRRSPARVAPGANGDSVAVHTVQYSSRPAAGNRPQTGGANRPSRAGLAAVGPESSKQPERRQPTRAKAERSAAPAKPEPKSREENPAHVVADLIRVRARVDGDETNVAEVITEGRVHVTQTRREGEAPFDLRGDRLHLRNYSEVHQVIDVKGTPAHIRDRGLQLEGPAIHFDRGDNLAEVEGAGVLRLPPSRRGFDGKPVDQPQSLDIFWRERMSFDGQIARFFAGVRTQMGGSEVRCEEMHVELEQRISFSEEQPEAADPKVVKVICRDGVEVKSLEYLNNDIVERRVARGFEFTFDQTNNSISAQGPGTLIFWRRGRGNRPGLGRATGAKANKPLQADSSEWEYTRVDFAGQMSGNIERKSTTFHSDVRIAYGPVPGPMDVVDVESEQPPLQGGRMRCEELNLTQYPGENGLGNNIALLARTNVELEGRTEHGLFHAKAAKLSYDQAKDLFILFGDGRRDATIWRESQPGSSRGSVEAQRMEFIPSQDRLQVDRASGAQGSG